MKDADIAFVYYSPEVIEQKRLDDLNPEQVKRAFGGENLEVYTDSKELREKLGELDYKNSVLLFMSSGNFSGVNLTAFAEELLSS
jgi:UDP-N-acetylmuramate: L-alanyl-gamma-D-glutamyl-meso-diaminopimelate ligase